MGRFLKNKAQAVGQVPGELLFIGDQKMDAPAIQIIAYNAKNHKKTELSTIDAPDQTTAPTSEALATEQQITWLNIHGLHNTELIRNIGARYQLHPLTLEDMLNTGQRPKMEEYDNYLFFNLKMIRYQDHKEIQSPQSTSLQSAGTMLSEQISIVLQNNTVLTLQEQPGDVFELVRERIAKKKGRIRTAGADYLVYTLLDTIIDNYLLTIERLGDKIEDLENEILTNPSQKVLDSLLEYKREMAYLRKVTRPCREFILLLSKSDHEFINDTTRPFIKDLLDLATQVVESIDTYREILSDYLNMYNTAINNRLNEIMKVLTIFSAIFIPLTFLAGIYGTNFKYIPELEFKYAYPIFLGVLCLVGGLMVRFFKKRKWF